MKILCVIDSLSQGGAQRQLVELAIGFKENNHSVEFLTYHNTSFYRCYLTNAGIEIYCIEEANYFQRLIKMRKFIRRGNYDGVLSFLEAPNFICEISGFPRRKWRLVVGERSADPRILRSLKLRFFRFFHLLADCIVCNSIENQKIVRRVNPFLNKSKCIVVYNLVDFSKWEQFSTPIRNYSKKIVVPANQSYAKNLMGLIKALELLDSSDLLKVNISWYGDRIEEPYIDNSFVEARERIEKSGLENVISFHPATNNISTIIQESDAVGLFSTHEGFPNAICEGMASGKPILCTAVSDIPKILCNNPKLLCDPDSPESIKDSLLYFINLSEAELAQIGQENYKIAKKTFNGQDIILSYLALFINN